ncbi:MAG: phosphate ABC transporter permease PstA [Actinobacteria bacterium]|nr:phosphate ABC transporter permease PstA [Actinomycetota bacterium]
MWGSFLVLLVPLGAVIFYVVQMGASQFSFDFLTTDLPVVTRSAAGGIGPVVYGTLLITGAATLMAVPLGVLGAIYLHEYGGNRRLAVVIRFLSDVMTGVPSIVMGLFIYTIWVLVFGLSAFAGALGLACLMLPVIIRSTEEMLRLVPDDLRQASYALGNRRWRTILTVVLPAAFGGIMSGIILAVARAAGETAPLLFTIGVVTAPNPNLFSGSNTALSTQIFANAQSPYENAQNRAWGAAFTLILLVFVLTVIARVVAGRYARKRGG